MTGHYGVRDGVVRYWHCYWHVLEDHEGELRVCPKLEQYVDHLKHTPVSVEESSTHVLHLPPVSTAVTGGKGGQGGGAGGQGEQQQGEAEQPHARTPFSQNCQGGSAAMQPSLLPG